MTQKQKWTLAFALATVFGMTAGTRADDAGARVISSFESASDISDAHGRNVGIGVADGSDGVTDGRQALRATFEPVPYPSVIWNAPSPWNWSGMATFAMDVTNQNSDPIEVAVRIDDDVRAGGNSHNRTGRAVVAPGRTVTLLLNLGGPTPRVASSSSAISLAHPMRAEPPLSGSLDSISMTVSGGIDLGHIVAFQVFLKSPPSPRRLIFDNFVCFPPRRRADGMTVSSINSGSLRRRIGRGKLTAIRVAKRTASEAKQIGAHPSEPGWDEYGGWADGPKLAASGFFTTIKRDGKWWFVDPPGICFSHLGRAKSIRPRRLMSMGVRECSRLLPDKGTKEAAFFRNDGKQYDFYAANLERKFGSDYLTNWQAETRRRLKSWGLNTVGAFSSSLDSPTEKVTGVVALGINGSHAKLSGGLPRPIADAFDPQFAADATDVFSKYAAPAKNNPYLLGYFVDNEMSWAGRGPENGRYDVAIAALAADANSPSKIAFVTQLKAKYPTIGAFNSAWGSSVSSFDALLAPFAPPSNLTDSAKSDLLAFSSAFARKYFSTVAAALKKADPNHLYLGCRFSYRTDEAVNACAAFADVVSFNIYEPRITDDRWGFTKNLGKPCIVGEFHFGALDRGMFSGGLVPVSSQKDRAQQYKTYVESILDNSSFIGAHWFQYIDEPLTGRPNDGENYEIGLVSVTDTPYEELTNAMRDVHKTMYARREKGQK